MSSNELITKANKKYGEGTLVKGSDLKRLTLAKATTGALAFDAMLGGGWPLNSWNEIVGKESNGKTVLALKTIAANQALNPKYGTLWIAAEPFVPDWAEKLGVDLDRVLIASTNVMEEAFQIVVDHTDDRAVDAVVIDSLPALFPSEEDDKGINELTVGTAPKMVNLFMRKTNKSTARSLIKDDRDVLCLIINQWRYKIGVMYGDPRTTPGGEGKNYSYFTKVEVARDDWINVGDKKVGLTIKARTLKNKVAPPGRVGMVDFYFDDCPPFHVGEYDTLKQIVSLGTAHDLITRRGAYYDYDGQTWKGKEDLLQGFREDLDLQEKISTEVIEEVNRKHG